MLLWQADSQAWPSLSDAQPAELTKSLGSVSLKQPRQISHRLIISNVLLLSALAVILVGIFGAHQDTQINQTAVTQAKKSQASISKSTPLPKTTKPKSAAVASYEVPAADPRYLTIPKLGVHARVLNVGLTPDGSINTPGNVFDTAWYNGSARPGQQGAMLVDGHISDWTTNGVFYELDRLVPGDEVQIERGDRQVFSYKVEAVKTYSANDIDMKQVLSPIKSGVPGLNLISCSGDVIYGTNDFNERIVVYTSQIN
ncbi:MAG TPA: class F sortase [Candidatus Saccharimonadales bacterium]|nr:class F sortase [Candidatus Saccharimonadales bacterium]